MTQNLEDLRVKRTRKLLQKALLEVATEKGFAHVTVRDITERAMVNRATFYRHYKDKYDLLAQYLEGLSGLIDSSEGPMQVQSVQSTDSPPAGLVKLLRHMQSHAEFYRVMLGRQGDPSFCVQSFRTYIEQGFRSRLSNQASQENRSRPPIDLTVSFLLAAGIGAIVWWLEDNQPCAPEQMASWIYQLSMGSISASLGSSR